MKKYLIEDVIKIYREDSNLTFVRKAKQTAEKDVVIHREGNSIVTGLGYSIFSAMGFLDSEWELVQKPVHVLIALEAYDNGKAIRHEDLNGTSTYSHRDTSNKLIDNNGYSICSSELLSGKWFIEVEV